MYKSLRLLLILLLGCNMVNAQTTVFPYTGAPASYTVPAGVTSVLVNVQGAPGGLNSDNITYDNRPGYGGCVSATIVVTPGQVLTVRVGGRGGNGTTTTAGVGGYNGGGNSTHALGTYAGGAGGGASDIYFGGTPLVVGGGGGGAGMGCGANDDRGGDGGGISGFPAEGEDGAGCGTITGGGGGDLTGNGMGGFCGTCVGPAGVAGSGAVGGDGGWGGGGGGGGYFGAGGGHWSGGGGGASYFGGTDVYMISENRGCRAAGDGYVSITPSCIPGVISGDNRVCIGSSIALTATSGGGSWSSSNIAIASVIGSGVVTGVGAGVADITYTIVPGIPGCRVIRSVTVDPLPLPISGAPFVCEEATVTLSTLSTGGFWSSSDASVATVGSATGDVTGVLAGPVVISYTSTTTGCSTTWPITVQPMPLPITGTPEVCVLGSTTLASGTPGGDWTSGGGGATVGMSTGVVSGVAAGVVTISYTLPAYPLCSRVRDVTVNPLPSVITSSTAMIACMGRTVTMNATPSGGTWSYTAGSGTGTIDASTGEFVPATTGTVTVTYTLPTGCLRTGVVTINPAPGAIGGTTSVVCEGSTISFNSGTTSGTWTSSATGTATASFGPGTVSTIAGISAGVATITFTATATTCFATRDVTVNTTPAPITGPTAVCTGTVTTYTTTPTGGTWTVSAGPGSISTTGDYTASAVGAATIRYTLPGTGCFRALAVAVNPTPNPIAGSTTVCVGFSINKTTTTGGGTWSSPEEGTLVTVVGAGASATITGVAAGVATISYTMPTGCYQIAYVTVTPTPSAIVATVTALCVGDCTTLTNPDGGGTWSSSLSASGSIDASTGVLCGVFAGNPVISYSFPSGCYVTQPVTINALPNPFVPSLSVCMGATTTILSGGGAGVWSSSATAVATIASISGDVTPVSPGITTLCYTFDATGCIRCETFTVNPAPSPIAGPNTVCEGATITYTSTPPGGTWTAVNPSATVGAGSGIVTGVTPGVDTIRYTVGSGCMVQKIVTVMPSPFPITGVMSICLGQSTVLTSGGAGTFGDNWTTTAGTGSVTFSGSTTTTTVNATAATGPGTATVTYTGSNGCSRSAVITINVLSTPITGPGTVCQGSNITLSNATAGGTWSSGTTTVATVNSTSGLVTGVTPGTSVITYLFGGCGTTVTVTVDPIPTSIVTPLSSTTLCPGDFVALTSTTGAGYSYQWRLGAANVPGATNATHVVSSATAGNYSVVIRLNSICPIASNTVTVTNNAVTATISPAGVVSACASTPPVLTGGPTGGFGGPFTYQWLLSGSPIVGVVTSTFTPTASGTYSVRVTNAAGCTGTSVVANVTLGASPLAIVTIVGATTFCSGDSVHLSTATGPGYTYQWRIGGLPVAGATNPNYTATMAGLHSVRVTNTTGCSTISSDVLITVTAPPPASIIPSGGTLLCAGGAVILDGPVGPYTYEWLKGGVIIPGATNASYNATTTGSYIIRVTSPLSGCSASSVVQTVNVVPAPIVSPLAATSFCWGGSVSLFASVISSAGTVEYRWKSGSTYIPGATNATYVASSSGTYSVEITVAPGTPLACPVTSLTTTVTEWPLPNPRVTFDGITLHTGVSFVSYQWYKNMIAIVGPDAYTPHCRNRGLGSYTVRVTDVNGCQSVSPAFVVTYFTPRPGEPSNTIPDGDVRIFPNPATNTLHIEAAELMHVIISSMDGRTVIDRQNAQDIDLSGITDGIYLVKLYNSANELVKTEKLVKAGN